MDYATDFSYRRLAARLHVPSVPCPCLRALQTTTDSTLPTPLHWLPLGSSRITLWRARLKPKRAPTTFGRGVFVCHSTNRSPSRSQWISPTGRRSALPFAGPVVQGCRLLHATRPHRDPTPYLSICSVENQRETTIFIPRITGSPLPRIPTLRQTLLALLTSRFRLPRTTNSNREQGGTSVFTRVDSCQLRGRGLE